MGIFSKFKKFMKGENTKSDPMPSYSSRTALGSNPLKSTDSLKYPERSTRAENPSLLNQKPALTTRERSLPPQNRLQSSSKNHYYGSGNRAQMNYSQEQPRTNRSLYERSTTPSNSNEGLVAAKLETLASQNQTIISLLREINMNLNYKVRR